MKQIQTNLATYRQALVISNCIMPTHGAATSSALHVSRLLSLWKKTVCAPTVLQAELAKKKGVIVEESTVRRHLAGAGYK